MDIIKMPVKDSYIEIKRFIYAPVNTNMYVMLSNYEALIIDPHESSEGQDFLTHNNIKNVKILLTHEHFDHTSGVNYFKERFSGEVVCHMQCANRIAELRNNRPLLEAFVLSQKDKEDGGTRSRELLKNHKPYICRADVTFEHDTIYEWQGHTLYLKPTPGHTPGSCCITLDNMLMFTGDSLIKGVPVITKFPGGNEVDFRCVTLPYLKQIKEEMFILPGHGVPFYRREVIIE